MQLLEFIITSSILTIMPGPDILFVAAQSMIQGRRAGIMVSLGLSSGLFVHTAAAALGISIIITNSPLLFSIIKYAGVAYLTYMGVMSLLEAIKTPPTTVIPPSENDAEAPVATATAADKKTGWKLYRTGVTMNLLNPKVIIFFLALFPQFIDASSKNARTDIFILGAVFALIAVTIFSAMAIITSFLSNKLSLRSLPVKTLGITKTIIYWTLAIMFLIN